MTPVEVAACVFCRVGERRPGTTTITLTRDEAAVVIRDVPAEVCDNCGHAYFDGTVVEALEQIHEAAIDAGAKYAVRDFVTKVA
ncbi:MAG: type II toxin-antitoxin system MqsA family antitoxin [Acidimicrobiia bacterium]|nr:type II toxin-antitoxin system MqsA family antitoxin [Acidimicrobiia bacterium]